MDNRLAGLEHKVCEIRMAFVKVNLSWAWNLVNNTNLCTYYYYSFFKKTILHPLFPNYRTFYPFPSFKSRPLKIPIFMLVLFEHHSYPWCLKKNTETLVPLERFWYWRFLFKMSGDGILGLLIGSLS